VSEPGSLEQRVCSLEHSQADALIPVRDLMVSQQGKASLAHVYVAYALALAGLLVSLVSKYVK